ncbi:MAG: excinuclease ABC subunit UvrA [Myxococcota bacterium]
MSDIAIVNARSHNLAGASCRVPLGSLTVITGVSGSGKSTLAFDTLYAEGQRRYVSSLSTYARQFLEQLPRPEVDLVSHLPPAVAIERRNRVTNARSTVGSATEILDHLRLLFAHVGETRCPDCDRVVEPGTVEAVAGRIAERFAGGRVQIGAPLPARAKEKGTALRERLVRDGYARILDGADTLHDASELTVRALDALRPDGLVLVDRLALRGDAAEGGRLREALANAFRLGGGRCVVVGEGGRRAAYQDGFACDGCGRRFATPRPALFSYNSSAGACPTCEGFGRVPGLDPDRVVPDPTKPLAAGAVAPFATPGGRRHQVRLLAACRRAGVPVDVPFEELSDADRRLVFEGDGEGWRGVAGFFRRLERKRYKVQNRVLIARYRRFDPCGDCGGTRLRPEARCVRVDGRSLPEVAALTLFQLGEWLAALRLPEHHGVRVARLLEDVRARVATAVQVGLDYVTLDRPTRTLSGGEAQRIQLAAALGGTLTASLYVLDEPSIGLHARDVDRLVGTLERIRDQGNTVVVVEHAPEVIGAADHVIDLGPGAGRFGGRVVAEGSVAELAACADSLTGRALAGTLPRAPRPERAPRGTLRIVGAAANNLEDVTVDVPLGQLVAFTGVSGAGKSTLVRSVLVGQLTRDPDRGACRAIEGAKALGEIVVVDPSPPSRSPRSNPATVSKAFELVRKRFADTREAKALGVGPGWFSFNVAGGRCEECEGAGEVVVDMHFLDDVRMPCAHCDGRRYRSEVLEVKLRGLSIVDVLALPIEEALDFFADDAKVVARLEPLARVGLGYLTLGQPLSTLSGGEAQRLRIALALRDGAPDTLYVLDEPTTGLHASDVEVLLGCLDDLLARGASVVVVEHNLDVIRRADHVIDLGPEGGPGGGRVVACGSPEEVARVEGSHTGAALRAVL